MQSSKLCCKPRGGFPCRAPLRRRTRSLVQPRNLALPCGPAATLTMVGRRLPDLCLGALAELVVGSLHLHEACGGIASRVDVRVQLEGELAVGLFDVGCVRAWGDAQRLPWRCKGLIVVSNTHSRYWQNPRAPSQTCTGNAGRHGRGCRGYAVEGSEPCRRMDGGQVYNKFVQQRQSNTTIRL